MDDGKIEGNSWKRHRKANRQRYLHRASLKYGGKVQGMRKETLTRGENGGNQHEEKEEDGKELLKEARSMGSEWQWSV